MHTYVYVYVHICLGAQLFAQRKLLRKMLRSTMFFFGLFLLKPAMLTRLGREVTNSYFLIFYQFRFV